MKGSDVFFLCETYQLLEKYNEIWGKVNNTIIKKIR